MKKLIFTQRVEVIASYNERRDCADQNIARFIKASGYLPIPLNNIPEFVVEYLETLKPDGIVLTGGNDIGGDAPERDQLEYLLLEEALQRDIPLFGFCRGMQVIANYFGAKLVKVDGHVASRHVLRGMYSREVNSYHNYGIYDVPETLEALAFSENGAIEALRHRNKAILGIMWHPEREVPFDAEDMRMMKELLEGMV
jgi:putative glutamine amidotransferase